MAAAPRRGRRALLSYHCLVKVVESLLVVVVRSVGKVEPRDAHSRAEELLQHLHGPRLGTERANDLKWKSAGQFGA